MCQDEEAQLVLFTALDVIEYARPYVFRLFQKLNHHYLVTRNSARNPSS